MLFSKYCQSTFIKVQTKNILQVGDLLCSWWRPNFETLLVSIWILFCSHYSFSTLTSRLISLSRRNARDSFSCLFQSDVWWLCLLILTISRHFCCAQKPEIVGCALIRTVRQFCSLWTHYLFATSTPRPVQFRLLVRKMCDNWLKPIRLTQQKHNRIEKKQQRKRRNTEVLVILERTNDLSKCQQFGKIINSFFLLAATFKSFCGDEVLFYR